MNSNQTTPVRPAGLRRPFLVSIAFGLLLLLPPPNAGAQATPVVFSFTNAAPITINNGFSDSTPFPSTIQVPALPGTLQNVTVTLFGLSDDQSYSIEILLTGPTGQGVDLMSEAGDGLVTNATVTIADAGEPFPAGVITSGAYQPSGASYASGTAFPFYSPFYQEDTTNQMAGFIGTMLGGSWSLSEYYTDFYPNGSISGGWSLNFTLLPAAPGVTNLAASPVATDSATLNANVSPGGAPTTVYFEYGLTTAYGNFSATNVLTNDVIDTQEVSLPITNLAAGATYHFQAVAQNEAGTNVAGDMTFVATAGPPGFHHQWQPACPDCPGRARLQLCHPGNPQPCAPDHLDNRHQSHFDQRGRIHQPGSAPRPAGILRGGGGPPGSSGAGGFPRQRLRPHPDAFGKHRHAIYHNVGRQSVTTDHLEHLDQRDFDKPGPDHQPRPAHQPDAVLPRGATVSGRHFPIS
jgi:hypothetical protein